MHTFISCNWCTITIIFDKYSVSNLHMFETCLLLSNTHAETPYKLVIVKLEISDVIVRVVTYLYG